jgi:hypothetical protein
VANKYVSDSKNQIYVGEEIKIILNSENPSCYSVQNIQSSRVSSKNVSLWEVLRDVPN